MQLGKVIDKVTVAERTLPTNRESSDLPTGSEKTSCDGSPGAPECVTELVPVKG
jgi:hypothetical protein